MKKRLLLLFVVLLLAAALCGCGRVEFSYVYTRDGAYSHQIDVYIDEELTDTGYTLESATLKIKEIFEGEGYRLETFEDKRHLRGVKNFASFEEVQADTLGSGLFGYEVKASDDLLFDYSTVTGEVMFDRASKQGLLLLLTKYGVPNFSIFGLEGMQSVDDVGVTYSMVTANRMKTNADEVIKQEDGYYRYIWHVEDSGNYAVEIQTREPRRTVWYALAVFASALTIAGFLIYATCKESPKNEESEQTV